MRIKEGTYCLYGNIVVECQSDQAGKTWEMQPNIYKPLTKKQAKKLRGLKKERDKLAKRMRKDGERVGIITLVWDKIVGELNKNGK